MVGGGISVKKQLKKTGNYIIEIEEGRKDECVISSDSQTRGTTSSYYYNFFGRGKLGKPRYGP